MQWNRHVIIAGVTLLCGGAAVAQEQAAEKSGYSLFNPTPRSLWREMSADRPDVTESPYTVDAGAVQLEMSFIEYAKDGGDDVLSVAPFNLKFGLTNQADLQIVFEPFVRGDLGGAHTDGIGDVQLRLKLNLWGNDAGNTAFAIMPFIKIPTASDDLGNDEFEGGLIFPYSVGLSENVGLGLMLETDFVYDEADDDYDIDFVHTAVLGFDLTDALGTYLEYIGNAPTDGDYAASLGTGLTLALRDDLVLDAGVNLGLTGEVDDLVLFTGMTIRF